MNMDGMNKAKRIYVEKHSEEDILGLLLMEYAKGTIYDDENKIWSVPNEVYDRLIEKE